ncbi:GNAT family N-acetyltransferase [Streptomyces sp. NPDC058861]|uniref:GNAT family N-acetyltransferase n=1 Tax=Streptomyces sp. NPDC058861 TaxID=3346653 RepID=UPI0036A4A985
MTGTAHHPVESPARRRRHARLIAALTGLVGASASAAAAVYQPIADAPPGGQGVEVSYRSVAELRTAWAGGVPHFAITDPGTDELTGYIGLRRIHGGNAEVGSWIAPWARGRGLAAGALLTAAGWALAPAADGGMGLHRIALHHSTSNPASCTVAARAGLLLEGTMRQATTDHTGTRYDSHLHARLATDPDPRARVPASA